MALAVREGGKILPNALGELREAVDLLRYYASQAREKFENPIELPGPTGESNQLSLHGRGPFFCVAPWNFPLAIFIGQVGGALAAGNTVLSKPAERTPLIAAAVRPDAQGRRACGCASSSSGPRLEDRQDRFVRH